MMMMMMMITMITGGIEKKSELGQRTGQDQSPEGGTREKR